MEKEINIAEILKDKPKGTKLYSPIFGKCKLSKVESDTCIRVHTDNNHYYFNKYGHYTTNAMNSIYGECCLFPSKEMHDWSKFAWKKGDVLVSNDDTRECIFDGWHNDNYTQFNAKHWLDSRNKNSIKYLFKNQPLTSLYMKEYKESEECYINTIEERLGGKLNMETLEVEKPMFKDGDIITIKGVDNFYEICIFKEISFY